MRKKKRQSSQHCHFTLLGSAGVKVVHRTLMKSTPGVNFINVLRAAFTSAEPKSLKKTASSHQSFLRFWDLHMQKLFVNMLVKLTPDLL